MERGTLARRLATTEHLSPLLMAAKRLGMDHPEAFERLAIHRGLRYYDTRVAAASRPRAKSASIDPVDEDRFSNEQLALALLSLVTPYSLRRLRMGAAMLAADGNRPAKIATLARRERCEEVVRHVAECGRDVEPDNLFWTELLSLLPPAARRHDPDVLPHPSRFVAMAGLSRAGRAGIRQWIRPTCPNNPPLR